MDQRSLLVTLTGPDRPGVTSRLFSVLSGFPVHVADVEQVVIRGRLTLGVLVSYAGGPSTGTGTTLGAMWTAVERVAEDLGLEVELSTGSQTKEQRRRGRLSRQRPRRDAGARRARGHRRAHRRRAAPTSTASSGSPSEPVTCIELVGLRRRPRARCGSSWPPRPPRSRSTSPSSAPACHRRAKRLIVMDVDSTLIQGEVIELLAAHAGCLEEVARVTEEAMRGELDFAESLRRRVALLEGLPRRGVRAGTPRGRAHARRPHPRPHAQAARLPVRDRQRRVHPDHRRPRRRPRHRLLRRQHAGGHRRQAHRQGRRRDRRPGRQGRAPSSASPARPACRSARPWPSATAPTTST